MPSSPVPPERPTQERPEGDGPSAGTAALSSQARRYRTIVADPPWPYPEGFVSQPDRPHQQDRERGASTCEVVRKALPYQAMTIAEIGALPISELAERDARLFCWATNRYLRAALAVVDAWGFEYRQLIVWDKTPNIPFGGSVARNAAEYLLVATHGKPARLAVAPSSVIRARKPRTRHSAKPDAFIDFVEQVSPGPYLEMFARRARMGWDYWGDESLGTAEVAA